MLFQASFVHIVHANLGQASICDNEVKLMRTPVPDWVRTTDPVIRSPARYLWTTTPANMELEDMPCSVVIYRHQLELVVTTPMQFEGHIVNGHVRMTRPMFFFLILDAVDTRWN